MATLCGTLVKKAMDFVMLLCTYYIYWETKRADARFCTSQLGNSFLEHEKSVDEKFSSTDFFQSVNKPLGRCFPNRLGSKAACADQTLPLGFLAHALVSSVATCLCTRIYLGWIYFLIVL